MQDYAQAFPPPRPPAKPPRRPFPLLLLLLPLLVVALFFAARHLMIQIQDGGERTTVVVRPNGTSVPPPAPPDDYDFYSTLTKEQAVRLDEDERPKPAQARNLYYILVEHFAAYGKASARAEEIRKLGMGQKIDIKVEPYSRQGDLVFRLRIGPYVSRAQINAARARLYEKEIPTRILVRSKT